MCQQIGQVSPVVKGNMFCVQTVCVMGVELLSLSLSYNLSHNMRV